MKLTDLPNDANALILVRLERAHDIARTAKSCRALRDAAGPAQGARRRLCREQFLATLRSLDNEREGRAAAVVAAEKLVTNERFEEHLATAEVAASIVDDAFGEAPPERHLALMKYIDALLKMERTSRWTPIARAARRQLSRFIAPLVKRLPRILEIAFAAATEQTAPQLKGLAANWPFYSWDPDFRDAINRFCRPSGA